jgi:DNA replication protein DnaC
MTAEELDQFLAVPLLERNKAATQAFSEAKVKHKLDRDDLRRMNIPEGFWSATLAGVTESARKGVANYERNFKRLMQAGGGLYLHGLPGRGKTGAATVLLKYAREHFRSGYFVRVAELREAIKHQQDYDAESLISDRVREVDLLVLDALTSHDLKLPFFRVEDLTELVAFRGERHRPTIITTTISEADMGILDNDFFETVGKYLVPLEVTGENRLGIVRKELIKLVKGGD